MSEMDETGRTNEPVQALNNPVEVTNSPVQPPDDRRW